MRRALIAFSIVLPLALFSVGACGGSAFDGPSGAAGTAATGTGGSGAFAGSSSGSAGRAAGGSIGVAGSSSSAGATSLGGFGSVGGTVGSAGTTSGSAGAGGATDIRSCSSNTDCEVVPVSCCSCGTGPVSSYTAINTKYTAQYNERCGTIDCVACPPTAFDPNNPVFYYVPTCQAGHCAVVDLRTTDVTACSSAAECSLRAGTACCSACSGTPIALNTKNAPKLSALVCGSDPGLCLACTPDFADYSVACTDRRCNVELSPCTSAHPCP
jgi:hypothetical protein